MAEPPRRPDFSAVVAHLAELRVALVSHNRMIPHNPGAIYVDPRCFSEADIAAILGAEARNWYESMLPTGYGRGNGA